MVKRVAEYQFAALLGDNAGPDGSLADFTSKVFGVYTGLFQGQKQALPAPTTAHPKPAYPTPGELEYHADASATGYFDSFVLPTNGPTGVPAEHYYTFDIGSVHFISFDSALVVGKAASAEQQELVRAWLTADLDAHVNQVTVVYDHHPAYTAGPHHGEPEEAEMRSMWFPIFATHGVDLVLSGHDRSYQRNTPQSGLTSYVVGTGGAAPTPVTAQSYTAAFLSDYAFLKVSVTGCSITTTAITGDGTAVDPWTFTAPTCSGGSSRGQLFADGFETGDFTAWTTVQAGPKGDARVQATTTRSGGFAAVLSASSDEGSYAYARKQLPSAQLDLRASADFRVTAEGGGGGNVPLIRLYDSAGARMLSLYRQNAAGSRLYIQHSGIFNTTTGVLPLDTWGNVQVKVHVNGTSSSVEVRLNGALIYQSPSADLGGLGVYRFQVGNDTTSQAFTEYIDNVAIDDGSGPGPAATASPSPSRAPTASLPPSGPPSSSPTASDVPSPAPSPVTILSDGFESGALTPWTVTKGAGGVATVQSAVTRAGVFAAHLSATTATGSYSAIRQSLGAGRTSLVAGADFRVPTEGPAGTNVPLIRLFDQSGIRIVNVYRQNANDGRIYIAFGGVTHQTIGAVPLATWTNVSVRVIVNGSSSTIELAIDGKPVYASTEATLNTSGLATFQLGNDTKKQAFDLFVDNVMIRDR
jgi:hypothetical protein